VDRSLPGNGVLVSLNSRVSESRRLFGAVPEPETRIRRHFCEIPFDTRAWPATTRHPEAEGSSYYRHFYMGLLREDGTPKLVLRDFCDFTPALGICQWFHFDDHRLERAVRWMIDLGVEHVRTGLSWADSFRPQAEQWFDRLMKALEPFQTTITYCFTPEHCGIQPNHTSPPREPLEFADFCARMTRRYA
jgi:beta-xylosidase